MKKIIKHIILVLLVLIIVVIISCILIWNREIRTLFSIKKVSDYPLYQMTYYGDYNFDEFLTIGAQSDNDLEKFVTNKLLKGLPIDLNVTGAGCTVFTVNNENNEVLMARNFDFAYAPSIQVYTNPDNGYASVSTVNLSFLGYDKDNLPNGLLNSFLTLAAPYLPFDGMNEKGLSIALLAVPEADYDYDDERITLGTTTAIRLVLDKASTIEEAVALLEKYNIYFSADVKCHFLIADITGNSVLVEYYNGKLQTVKTDTSYQVASNFIAYNNLNIGEGYTEFDRYNTVISEIGTNYVIPTAIAKDLQDNDISDRVTYTIKQNDVEVTNIDTSYLTQYEILYKVTANKMTVSKLKTVKVVDTLAPVITGADNINIYSTVTSFDLLAGVSATDNSGKVIEIKTSGNLSLGIAGEYEITYTATDESGNESVVVRTITVIDKTYSLILDAQGGTVSSPVTIHHNGTYGSLETPVWSDHTFLGWYDEAISGTKITSTTAIINADHTLYAHWTPIYYYTYTGSVQTFTASLSGTYLFETWGAQGGSDGGKGAYASGELSVTAGTTYYIYVGQSPTTSSGGFNGGGSTGTSAASYGVNGGGGATDIRITSANEAYDQKRRLIVAAGGGSGSNGGAGGTLTGESGITTGASMCIDGSNYANYATGCIFRITLGGTQTNGGVGGLASVNSYPYTYGNWSQGESGSWYQGSNNASCSSNNCNWSTGGGGGWYGGGGGANTTPYSMGGGGGSSFVSGYSGCQAVNGDMQPIGSISITGISFTNPNMISGISSMPNHEGTGTMTGNSGNGYAKISYIP